MKYHLDHPSQTVALHFHSRYVLGAGLVVIGTQAVLTEGQPNAKTGGSCAGWKACPGSSRPTWARDALFRLLWGERRGLSAP